MTPINLGKLEFTAEDFLDGQTSNPLLYSFMQGFADRANALLSRRIRETGVEVVADDSIPTRWWERPWKNARIDIKRAYLVCLEEIGK